MASVPRAHMTDDEYLAIERAAETKSEFYDGQMYAMSGASFRHGRVAGNLYIEMGNQLRDGPCQALMNDLRMSLAGSGYAYPDIVVVCGEPQFRDNEFDTLMNPVVVIEVLSPSTENWDRRGKFGYYRRITTLRQYVLIEQASPAVERFDRQPDETWEMTRSSWPDGVLTLDSIGVTVSLRQIYRLVFTSDNPA